MKIQKSFLIDSSTPYYRLLLYYAGYKKEIDSVELKEGILQVFVNLNLSESPKAPWQQTFETSWSPIIEGSVIPAIITVHAIMKIGTRYAFNPIIINDSGFSVSEGTSLSILDQRSTIITSGWSCNAISMLIGGICLPKVGKYELVLELLRGNNTTLKRKSCSDEEKLDVFRTFIYTYHQYHGKK